MSRTLFGSGNFTTENVKINTTIDELLKDYRRVEVEAAYLDVESEADSTVEMISNVTFNGLEQVVKHLNDKDSIDQLTYESYVNTINNSSKLLGDGLTVEAFKSDIFDEKKEEILGELETTVEGFLTKVTSALSAFTRKNIHAINTFISTLYVKQEILSNLSSTLRAKMNGKKGGDVSGKVIKSTFAGTWFRDQEHAIKTLSGFVGLRNAMPKALGELQKISTTEFTSDFDTNGFLKLSRKPMDVIGKEPGVLHAIKTVNGIDHKYIMIPDRISGFRLWGLDRTQSANVSKAAVATMAVSIVASVVTGGLALPALSVAAEVATIVLVIHGLVILKGVVFKKTLPALSWKQVDKALSHIEDMGKTHLTLKTLTKIMSDVEKAGRKVALNQSGKIVKQSIIAVKNVVDMYSKMFRIIYSDSVACAKAGLSYCAQSIKVGIKASTTSENILESNELYQDASKVHGTLESVDNLLNPIPLT